ncbi:MAG: hypothetical protein NXY57DRAFT_968075 [Lentinula lateritia]|nr:MAG: hypothetical protein NXY57DRAFT_968075 [Lentinula lateritia]
MSLSDPLSSERPPISRSLEEPYEDMIQFSGPTQEELDDEIAYRALEELMPMEKEQALM